jgi:hypothetical protein
MRLASVGFSGIPNMMCAQPVKVSHAIVDALLCIATGKLFARQGQPRIRDVLAGLTPDIVTASTLDDDAASAVSDPPLITSHPQIVGQPTTARMQSVSGAHVPQGQTRVELKSPSAFLAAFEVVADSAEEVSLLPSSSSNIAVAEYC